MKIYSITFETVAFTRFCALILFAELRIYTQGFFFHQDFPAAKGYVLIYFHVDTKLLTDGQTYRHCKVL